MSLKIAKVDKSELHVFCTAIHDLARETTNFPQNALVYYKTIITEKSLLARYKDTVLLEARQDLELAGLIYGTGIEGGVGTIIWLLVVPKFQKLGIGGKLFNKACDIYKQNKGHKIKLTVPEKKTVEFYEKQGMNLEGFHPNHWWSMDIWSMGKNLK